MNRWRELEPKLEKLEIIEIQPFVCTLEVKLSLQRLFGMLLLM